MFLNDVISGMWFLKNETLSLPEANIPLSI